MHDIDDEVIRRLLEQSRVWAVVGLGANPDRPAYRVARFLQDQGKRIVPVHPTAQTVHGETVYRSLADIPFPVDVVDVFRRSEDAGAVADEALLRDDVRAVWFQLGVVDEDAAQQVRAAGRVMVMDRCPAIEWPRLLS
ncbi:CoA-binding protein [Marinactinospora thermotolerans]|uniref:CoA-binding domain-containing protein n=1 Tax=Marinactinospora thermotolerans DSM 45154 TaxID=1122192 RepID=A0A1T4QPW4_9ACTN|nr:CoA-binding protein [Marinactinospora thermotolerans]SKA05298.1 hypothetical protein SAMN02745673_02334 [Marinactinospora thermotolerans DSM 45154]